jgi:hypothetical protein
MDMGTEIRIGEIPIPLVNYVKLIRNKTSPYYDIVWFLLKEMETCYTKAGKESETVYTINPRVLQEEIEKLIENEKLTTMNICRTVRALLYGSRLRKEKDFYFTKAKGGRLNYHIIVNTRTLNTLSRFI